MTTLFEQSMNMKQPDLFTDNERPSVVKWSHGSKIDSNESDNVYLKLDNGESAAIRLYAEPYAAYKLIKWSIWYFNESLPIGVGSLTSEGTVLKDEDDFKYFKRALRTNNHINLPDDLIEYIIDYIKTNEKLILNNYGIRYENVI